MTIYLPSPPGPVEVTVLDQNNNLVSGADVYLNLFGTGGNTTATKKTTTATGKVSFPNVTGTSMMFQAVKVSTFQVQMYTGPMARKVTIKFSAPPVKSEVVITVFDTDGTTPVPNAVVKLGLWSEGQQGGSSIISMLSGTTNAQGVVTFAQAPEMFLIAESTVGTKKGSAWLNSVTPTPPATNRTGNIFLSN
jgi:protocatechuate 3,4-dioxygenase beta subunit